MQLPALVAEWQKASENMNVEKTIISVLVIFKNYIFFVSKEYELNKITILNHSK